ncbi:MAG: class I SAM-dependent methyltransferase [Pyrinomonadaceae bacterium]|nr:class I SAM-dependent methyltransferase [Pyrinomonadaceae bacterium]
MAVSEKELLTEFEGQLERLDIKLFEKIASQTTDRDKRSLLACQLAVRILRPTYTYLEIGSYLGGSLQPYLLDAQCSHIYSIDKRPPSQPDERGMNYEYENNSTQRMLDNLKQISEAGLSKINCIDDDASNISESQIQHRPQICFIDGEHTDEACFNDFLFCLKVVDKDGIIVFHDAPIIYNGLERVTSYLKAQRADFRAYILPDSVFVVELNDFRMHEVPHIKEMLVNNYVAYIASLQANDHFRNFANKPIFQFLRNVKLKFTRSNVSN